jgi:hypothetical protein
MYVIHKMRRSPGQRRRREQNVRATNDPIQASCESGAFWCISRFEEMKGGIFSVRRQLFRLLALEEM